MSSAPSAAASKPGLLSMLNAFAAACARRAEIALAVMVLGIVFMMVMPLPTELVDVLIALNFCMSTLVLVLSLYLSGPLAFSTLPALLLLTTLFRLGISISTTRLILLQGDAGNIVEAFGNFVVGGNFAVGLVIFLILAVVQFLVITKGAERVAEVAARFTLDAMPGKQLSIDSDLRSGLLTADEARTRRADLAKEGRLFGAMDGAMKFVKGDAIAGLVIVAVNLIGGFAIGILQQDMSGGDALRLYSVLTIGDGLVAQIPALLIALTSGIVITRVAPESQAVASNMGTEIVEQLLRQPRAWAVVGVAMLAFALVPGMPTAVFLVLAMAIGLGLLLNLMVYRRAQAAAAMADARAEDAPTEANEDLRRFEPARPYLLLFPASMAGDAICGHYVQAIRQARNRIVAEYGVMLPSLDIGLRPEMPASEFRFCLYEIPIFCGSLRADAVAVPADADVAGLMAAAPVAPIPGEETWQWIHADAAAEAEQRGLPVKSGVDLASQRLTELFFRTGSQLIGVQETAVILGWLEREQPELSKELQRVLTTSQVAGVLQRLAAERISLRGIKPIAETLADIGKQERDVSILTEYVRIALRNQICHSFSHAGKLYAYMLETDTERNLRDIVNGGAEFDPDLGMQLSARIAKTVSSSAQPSVLLVAGDLRHHIRAMLEHELVYVPVISMSELVPHIPVETLGRIGTPVDRIS